MSISTCLSMATLIAVSSSLGAESRIGPPCAKRLGIDTASSTAARIAMRDLIIEPTPLDSGLFSDGRRLSLSSRDDATINESNGGSMLRPKVHRRFSHLPLKGTPLHRDFTSVVGVREDVTEYYERKPRALRYLVILYTEKGEGLNRTRERRARTARAA